LGGLGLAPLALRWRVDRRYGTSIYTVQDVPPRKVAIVFGAGITPDGRPLPALADRVLTGVELYQSGKAEKLLMSGDNRFVDDNEPVGAGLRTRPSP
jgi:vancomycin permeability regulator SanA